MKVGRFRTLHPRRLQHFGTLAPCSFKVPSQHVEVAKYLLMVLERRPGQNLIHWHSILLLSVHQGVGTSTTDARNPNRLLEEPRHVQQREPKRSLLVHQHARALHPRSIATGPQPLLFRFLNNLSVCIKLTFILSLPCHFESRCQVERRSVRSFL